MKKKVFWLYLVLPVFVVSLVSCSFQLPWSSQTAQTTETAQTALQARLAVGTLMLEDTELAVTTEQAKALLPLWKAVKSLSASDTASQAEIQALYDQIQETMTAEQLQAIQDMDLTPETTQALMQKLGIEGGFMAGGQNLSESDIATRTAQRQSQGSAGGPPGGMVFGGGPDMMGPPPDAGGQSGVQRTPASGQRRMGGMNMIFINPLIRLLEQRAKD